MWIAKIVSASNRNCEAVPPNRRAVRRADVLLYTNYVPSDVCEQKCTGPTIAWPVRWLSWKTISVPDLAGTINTAAVPKKATKQPITPSIPIARGWITRLMTSAYNIYDRSHFEFYLSFEFYFYRFSVYIQVKHDSFYAQGTLWCRFLDNT